MCNNLHGFITDDDDDDNDVFGEDDLFGNGDGFGDGDVVDIFEEEDRDNEYDIFGRDVDSPGQCGKRNSNSNTILKVTFTKSMKLLLSIYFLVICRPGQVWRVAPRMCCA